MAASHTCKIVVSKANELLISRLVNEGSYSVIDPFCKKRRAVQQSDSDSEVSQSDEEDETAKRRRTFVIVPATDDEGGE